MTLPAIHIEIDKIDRDGWNQLITQFSDATVYQTWSYGSVGRRPDDVSHIVLKAGDEIIGCCQVIIRRVLPLFGVGIADIKWGPLCRKDEKPADPEILRQSIQQLKREYGAKRNLLLRIWPHATREQKASTLSILEAEGFRRNTAAGAYRTLHLALSPSLDELRGNLSQRWRRQLNKAEKNGLTLIEGTSDELYRTFFSLGKEMRERKKFVPGVDYETYGRIQADLPASLKMRIVICESQGEPICASVYSAIGDTGIYLLGATGDSGLRLNAGFLIHWHMIGRLKESGVRYYDLGGIDQIANPGVTDFKLGLAGRQGYEVELLGEFHGCFGFQGKVGQIALKGWASLPTRARSVAAS
jgi:lipid II:glycine glycyltransferase (peptidoglycan interpeptide bridge formation enzyme)